MTRDEVREAAMLSEAAYDIQELGADVRGHDEEGDPIGFGCSHGYSDAGSVGLGAEVKIPKAMIVEMLDGLYARVVARLAELGIDP